MKKNMIAFISLFCFFSLGCATNTSVRFFQEEPLVQYDNNISFEVFRWFGIQILYFEYQYIGTFFMRIEADENISDVALTAYSVIVPELGINFHNMEPHFNGKEPPVIIPIKEREISANNPNAKRFWGSNYALMDHGFISSAIQNEKQLVEFKKVKYVFLLTTFEYTIMNEKKTSVFTWKFRPKVIKSSAFWDKWMSV